MAIRYVPIDELLERPRVRVLRALRRFDWVTSQEISDALDIFEENERNNISTHLGRLVKLAQVERRVARGADPGDGRRFEYRITNAGRADLDAILTGERDLKEWPARRHEPTGPLPGHFLWRGRWRPR